MNPDDMMPSITDIFQKNRDAVFLIDLDGSISYCNPAAEYLYGYSKEELKGVPYSSLLTAENKDEFETARENILFGQEPEAQEVERITKDRNRLKLSVAFSAIKTADNRISGIISIERRPSQYITVASRSQALLETAPDAMVIVNSKGQILLANAQTEKLFGYTKTEMLGREVEMLIPSRFLGKHKQHRDLFFSNPKTRGMGLDLSLSGRRKNGQEFPIEISLSPLVTEEDTYVSAAIRDITDRKNAEAKFRNLLEAAPDAMVIVNESGIIQLVNAQTEKLFGYIREELIGQTVELLMPMRFGQSHKMHQQVYFKSPKVRQMGEGKELYGIKKNGNEFPVEISLSPLETPEGLLVSAAIRDISEKKLLERQIREANITLERKVTQRTAELERKNKELEQFAYVASHDLQEPLRTTSGFVELFRKKYQGAIDQEADKMLHYMLQANDRMKILIKDLLDYSRIGRMTEIQEIDCNIILKEVEEDLNSAITEVNAIVKRKKLPVIQGYRTEIKQLFQNLISNSIKFRKKNIAPVIEVSAEKINNHWKFELSDNGIGIDPKYTERIFIIFQRLHTRSEYEGSGIGLAHCKKIVELHGGKIWVESEPDKGSRFYFTIHELL